MSQGARSRNTTSQPGDIKRRGACRQSCRQFARTAHGPPSSRPKGPGVDLEAKRRRAEAGTAPHESDVVEQLEFPYYWRRGRDCSIDAGRSSSPSSCSMNFDEDCVEASQPLVFRLEVAVPAGGRHRLRRAPPATTWSAAGRSRRPRTFGDAARFVRFQMRRGVGLHTAASLGDDDLPGAALLLRRQSAVDQPNDRAGRAAQHPGVGGGRDFHRQGCLGAGRTFRSRDPDLQRARSSCAIPSRPFQEVPKPRVRGPSPSAALPCPGRFAALS